VTGRTGLTGLTTVLASFEGHRRGKREVFDGLEGVSVGGFTDDYFERAVAAVALLPGATVT